MNFQQINTIFLDEHSMLWVGGIPAPRQPEKDGIRGQKEPGSNCCPAYGLWIGEPFPVRLFRVTPVRFRRHT